MDNKNYAPASGRVIGEDGKAYNIVALLGGGTPVSDRVYNIDSFSPASGRVIGEDDKVYNLVDLLSGIGGYSTDIARLEASKQDKPTIVTATATTATIQPNTVYEYGEVSELNLTLADTVGNYEVVFESGETATVLSLTSQKSLLWHNEPVVLPNKVYTLAVEVGSVYARAVLSYAEPVS